MLKDVAGNMNMLREEEARLPAPERLHFRHLVLCCLAVNVGERSWNHCLDVASRILRGRPEMPLAGEFTTPEVRRDA
jgi:hypothetical protein